MHQHQEKKTIVYIFPKWTVKRSIYHTDLHTENRKICVSHKAQTISEDATHFSFSHSLTSYSTKYHIWASWVWIESVPNFRLIFHSLTNLWKYTTTKTADLTVCLKHSYNHMSNFFQGQNLIFSLTCIKIFPIMSKFQK